MLHLSHKASCHRNTSVVEFTHAAVILGSFYQLLEVIFPVVDVDTLRRFLLPAHTKLVVEYHDQYASQEDGDVDLLRSPSFTLGKKGWKVFSPRRVRMIESVVRWGCDRQFMVGEEAHSILVNLLVVQLEHQRGQWKSTQVFRFLNVKHNLPYHFSQEEDPSYTACGGASMEVICDSELGFDIQADVLAITSEASELRKIGSSTLHLEHEGHEDLSPNLAVVIANLQKITSQADELVVVDSDGR